MGKWDHKDASGVPAEVNELFGKFEKILSDVRQKQGELETEVKKRGNTDPLITASIKRMDAALDDLKADVDRHIKKASRPSLMAPTDTKSLVLEAKANAEVARWIGSDDIERAGSVRAAYAKAYKAWERRGEDRLQDPERKALAIGTADGGGFWVEPARSDRIIQRVFETSEMRNLADGMTIGTTHVILPVDRDDIDAVSVGEQTTRTEGSTNRIGEVEIRVHEMNVQTRITQNMLDDAVIDIEQWNDSKVSARMARKENTWFVTGDGVKQARGFATYATSTALDDARAYGTLQHIATGVSGGFASSNPADHLLDLIYAFKSPYRANLQWALNRVTLGTIRKFKDGQGNYIAGPRLDKEKGIIEMLWEYPTNEFADMPVPAANALAVALGDFKQGYMIVDRQGLRQLRDPYTRKGSVIYDTTKRVGGDVIDFDAIKFLKLA